MILTQTHKVRHLPEVDGSKLIFETVFKIFFLKRTHLPYFNEVGRLSSFNSSYVVSQML